MKEINADNRGSINCTSSRIPTCKKAINNFKKVQGNKPGVHKINGDLYKQLSTNPSQIVRSHQIDLGSIRHSINDRKLFVSDYIYRTQENVPEGLLSRKNLNNIQTISQMFPGEITTFLGFETRLWEKNNNADFAFAISGVGNDREVLTNFLEDNPDSSRLLNHQEWRQIYQFSKNWSDSHSELFNTIQCFWLEFDMPDEGEGEIIPSVFFGPSKKYNSNSKSYDWLINSAIPLLSGSKIPKSISTLIIDTIKKMPENATIFQVGTMLSRSVTAIRLHINRLEPDQIIPFLKEIKWRYDTSDLEQMIDDLKDMVDRFVLSFDVLDDGIGPKLGLELSFIGDDYLNKKKWENLLNYLEEKKLCLPEKKEALLHYTSNNLDDFSGGILKPIYSATTYQNDIAQSDIIRYINHIKLVYQPGTITRAKAYPAIRLFQHDDSNQTQMI